MKTPYRFNRLEFSGSLGDLGTLLPLAIAMILINGMNPLGTFLSIGLYYIIAGIWFGVPVPIQPMKLIGAYAIVTAMTPAQIAASGLLMSIILIICGATGAISLIGKYTPKPVIRGVQLATGMLLLIEGVKLIIGASRIQVIQRAAEPFLSFQTIGSMPVGIIIGIIGILMTFLLLENKKIPAGLIIICGGICLGCFMGNHSGFEHFRFQLNLPQILPFSMPTKIDLTFALFAVVIPQVPMTLGNAVIGYVDLSKEYFGVQSRKVTLKSACLSMGFANLISFLLGGIPLCHGAGGLAAHYRFGARTAGSNLIIGLIFILLALTLGNHVADAVKIIPMSVLGVLLFFSGSQLALAISDMTDKKDILVCLLILGITLALNLAVAFIAGIAVAWLLKFPEIKI